MVLTSLAWGASSLKSELGLGADYSNQRYAAFSLDTALLVRDTTNRDTLAKDTEGKTSWGLTLNLDSDRTQLDAVNTINLSTLSIRDILNLTVEQELAARLKVQASYDGEVRFYHRAFPQLGDTSYRRDYWNHNGRVTLKYNPSDRLGISVGDALEYLHYPKPDAYSYDYLLNRARVSLSSDLGDLSALDVEYDWSKRWAIQADSQDYDDHSLQAGFNGYFGANWHLKLDNDLGRRSYPSHERSYWEESPAVTVGFDFSDKFSTLLEAEVRTTSYDSVTELYRNQLESGLKLIGEIKPSPEFTIRVGPQLSNCRSLPLPQSEDYRETALILGLEYLKPGKLMISFEDRPGRRIYPWADTTDPTNYLSNQSNYLFNELNLSLNWTIVKTTAGALCLNGLASLAPEWHTDQADNLSFNTYTLELKYSF